MPSLLSIVASPRGDYSVSTSLVTQFVGEWKKNHPGSNVISRELVKTELPFVDVPWMSGAYTPEEQHSPEMKEALKISNELIAELQAADEIVLGTPMYNFSTPANLKAYIDHIVRIGKTVSSSYEGLLKNKKATVIVASGGDYRAGSFMESYNSETAYLKQILGFIGISDVTFILAGGSNDVAQGKKTMGQLLEQYTPEVLAAVK